MIDEKVEEVNGQAISRLLSGLSILSEWLLGSPRRAGAEEETVVCEGQLVPVRGRVLATVTGCPVFIGSGCVPGKTRALSNVVVAALSRTGQRIAVGCTDEDGNYEVRLEPGTYILVATELGIGRRAIVREREIARFDLIQPQA